MKKILSKNKRKRCTLESKNKHFCILNLLKKRNPKKREFLSSSNTSAKTIKKQKKTTQSFIPTTHSSHASYQTILNIPKSDPASPTNLPTRKYYLETKKSPFEVKDLPRKGRALFTKIPLEKDQIIGYYFVEEQPKDPYKFPFKKSNYHSHYLIQGTNGKAYSPNTMCDRFNQKVKKGKAIQLNKDNLILRATLGCLKKTDHLQSDFSLMTLCNTGNKKLFHTEEKWLKKNDELGFTTQPKCRNIFLKDTDNVVITEVNCKEKLFAFKTTRYITPGEEICCDYGAEYNNFLEFKSDNKSAVNRNKEIQKKWKEINTIKAFKKSNELHTNNYYLFGLKFHFANKITKIFGESIQIITNRSCPCLKETNPRLYKLVKETLQKYDKSNLDYMRGRITSLNVVSTEWKKEILFEIPRKIFEQLNKRKPLHPINFVTEYEIDDVLHNIQNSLLPPNNKKNKYNQSSSIEKKCVTIKNLLTQ